VIEVALSIAREVALGAWTWSGESRQVPHGELMPRSSSLAITIVRTATDAPADPGDIRALIDAAIEHMTQIAGLPEPTGPSAPAAGAGTPACGLAPPQHKPESVAWFRAVLGAPSSDATLRRLGIAVRVSALAG
jgi:hypothetical protein